MAVPTQTAAELLEVIVAVGSGLTVTTIAFEVPTGSLDEFVPAAITAR